MILAVDSVTVRFWAGARDAAGCSEEPIASGSIAGVVAALEARHGDRLARVMAASAFLLDGETVDRSSLRVVEPGALLEVLPPYAGG